MDLSVLAQTNETETGGGGETASAGELRMESAGMERYSASLNQEGLNSESQISPNGLQGDFSAVFRNPYDNSSPDYDVAVYYLGFTQNLDGTFIDRSAMCLSYGAKATVNTNRCTYTPCSYSELTNQSGGSIITDYKQEQLKGVAYAYEKITHGTSYLEELIDSEYEKLKSEIEQTDVAEFRLGTDGYNRLAYTMFQIAAWRISCDTFSTTSRNNNTSASYLQDTATIKAMVSQLFGRTEEDVVTRQAIAMYDYMKMMVYQSSGEYKSSYNAKFKQVRLYYYRPVATHPEAEQWYEFQNIFTWRIEGSEEYKIKLSKTGTQSDLPVKDATYGIYADSAATVLLTTMTTNSNGEVTSDRKFTEGYYYIKEISAPAGYALDNKIYPVTISSITETQNNTFNENVSEQEKYNASVTLYKYDSASQDTANKKGLAGAIFEVQQYCAATKQYVPIGTLKDEGNGKYTLDGQKFKILAANGQDTGRTITGRLLYTQQNEGKFRILETVAPSGYTISDEVKTFTITGENQEIIFDNADAFYETGLEGSVRITKYDALTKEKLSGAIFELQEYNVNLGRWLTCGNLNEIRDENGAGTGSYQLSDYVKYNYYAGDGATVAVSKRGKLVYTAYNKGKFRIVETQSPNRYQNSNLYKTEEFVLSDTQKSFNFQYFETADILQQGATNLGFYNTVRVGKYDAITKEKVTSGTSTFTIYEYIAGKDRWYEVGTMKYNDSTKDYSCFNQVFRFHTVDGSVIPAERMEAAGCQAGRLYYTTANQGKFKVVETKAPDFYTLGENLFRKEFQITNANGNAYEHYFTSLTNGARNTGISGTAEVTKYDRYTRQKLTGATFTVYEYAASKDNYSRAVGTLVDSGTGVYTTTGGTYRIHAVDGSYTEFSGTLVYTTENQGKFKIVETAAPAGYTNDKFEEYIQMERDGQKFTFNTYATGAKDTPLTGTVSLTKVDSDTKQKLAGATFELQEYNNVQKTYIRIGTLKDQGNGTYVSEGAYRYHGASASVILAKTEDYPDLNGKLLVTSYNEGKFRMVETVAPSNYWIGSVPFVRVFTITSVQKDYRFNTMDSWVENYPYYGTVSVTKQDAVTGGYLQGAEFTLYEWNSETNQYEHLCQLKDKGNGYYTMDDVSVKQEVETTEGMVLQELAGKVRYTKKNQGKFKVMETRAPYYYMGYDMAGMTFTQEFNIRNSKDSHAKQVNENTVAYQYYAESGAWNIPSKAQLSIIKQDDSSKDGSSQGDAALDGAVYLLMPREDILHPDVSLNQSILYPAYKDTLSLAKQLKNQEAVLNDTTGAFSKDEKNAALEQQKEIKNKLKEHSVAELVTKMDENGICRAEAGNLPLGQYYLIEIEAPEGYLLNPEPVPIDLVYEGEIVPLIQKEAVVTDTIKQQAFTFIKYRRNPQNPEELVPLEGAGFTVYQVSELIKLKESGTDIATMTDEELEAVLADLYQTENSPDHCKTYCFDGETVATEELFSDETGAVRSPELPYGTYVVVESTNPTDDSADIQPFVVRITADGQTAWKSEDEIMISEKRVVKQLTDKVDELLETGILSIEKTGDTLTGADTVPYTVKKEEVSGLTKEVKHQNKVFQYNQRALAGVTFTISVAEDIYLPDGRTDVDRNPVLASHTRADGSKVMLKKGATVDTIVTDSNGFAEIRNLPYGTYLVTETDTPEGYLAAEPFQVTIEKEEGSTDEVKKTVVNDRKKLKLSFTKRSAETEEPFTGAVSGAVYGLYVGQDICSSTGETLAKAGELLELAVSKADGSLVFQADLPYGFYYVKEYQAPAGYRMSEEQYSFAFAENCNTDSDGIYEISHVLEDEPTKVLISKKSFTSGRELSGAELQILDSEGNVVTSWITDGTEKEIKGLKPGTYTLRETRAPFGYVVSETVEFTVADSGEIQTITMYDKEVMGCIEITKVDGDTNEKLQGAIFELRREDGEVIDTLVTDENGYAKSKEVFICTYDNSTGEYQDMISYYLVEVKAPEGYTIDSTKHKYTFEYLDDQTPVITIQSVIKNHKAPVTGDETEPWKQKQLYLLLLAAFVIGGGFVIGKKKKTI